MRKNIRKELILYEKNTRKEPELFETKMLIAAGMECVNFRPGGYYFSYLVYLTCETPYLQELLLFMF